MSKSAGSLSPSDSSEQDRALVKQALEGNEAAYKALVQKYSKALTMHVQRLVRKPEEVDDLVQESFIKAFSALGSYSVEYAFSTWLYKIATNHAIDYLRKRKLKTYSIDSSSCPTPPIARTATSWPTNDASSSRTPSTPCPRNTTKSSSCGINRKNRMKRSRGSSTCRSGR